LKNTASDIITKGTELFNGTITQEPKNAENKMKIQLFIRPDTSKIYNKQGIISSLIGYTLKCLGQII
jgi:hypothetical protein